MRLQFDGYGEPMSRGQSWALGLAAIGVAVIGVALGALPLSGAEPDGLFVSCGPALFGRPSPLPHEACADAYAPLPGLSIGLMVAAFVLACVAARGLCRPWLQARSRREAVSHS